MFETTLDEIYMLTKSFLYTIFHNVYSSIFVVLPSEEMTVITTIAQTVNKYIDTFLKTGV